MPTGGTVLFRKLQQQKNGVLKSRRRALPFENPSIIPMSLDLRPGARTLIQDQVVETGKAVVTSPDAVDPRLIEISVSENEYRIMMVMAGYPVTWGENEARQYAQSQGVQYNTQDIKMASTIRAIEEKCNSLAAFGESSLGVTGMLNNASVTLTNSSFDAFDANSTADDIADWFLGEIGAIAASTNNVEYPTNAGISTELWNLMTRRRMPDSSETVLSYILRTQREANTNMSQGIRNIFPLQECRSANLEANGAQSGGTNKDRIVLYPLDREVFEKHKLNGAVQLFPEDWAGHAPGKKIYPMYTCDSEVIINFPGAFRYVDHPKSA